MKELGFGIMAMVTDDVWVEYFSRLFGHAKSLIQVPLCAFVGLVV